jgi:hypothetical protein
MEEEEREKYKQAIEQAIVELPVEDGTVSLESIWLETSLPQDLILEVLKEGQLNLPLNVERIVTRSGKTLLSRDVAAEAKTHA